MLGKVEGERRRRWQENEIERLDGIINSLDVNSSQVLEMVKVWGAWRAAVPGVAKSRAE